MGRNKFLLYNLSLVNNIKYVLYVKVYGKFSGFFVGRETQFLLIELLNFFFFPNAEKDLIL